MACGDRYAYLLKVGEHRPDRPCGSKPWCSEADAKIALGQARLVFDVVRSNWNTLVGHENTVKNWAGSDKLRPSVLAYEQAFADLEKPGWWVVAGADAAVASAWANAAAGTCIADELAMALEAMPDAPAPAPGPPAPPDPLTPVDAISKGLGAAVAIVAVLGVGWLVLEFSRAQK